MLLPRVIPCLLLKQGGLYKTAQFGKPRYVGDPINVMKIFNDKEVDEIVLLDISATRDDRPIDLALVSDIASECFMPLCYGGGVRTLPDFDRLFNAGIEKVAVNTAAVETPELVRQAAEAYGSQSIVVSIDVRRARRRGERIFVRGGTRQVDIDPVDHGRRMQDLGAGEILLTSIDREGTGMGYDLELTRRVSAALDIPVIANGGAATLDDLRTVLSSGGASGASAGSMFVFHGRHQAVLISYPSPAERRQLVTR